MCDSRAFVLQECIDDSLCAPSCLESAGRTMDAYDAHVMSATFSGSARLFELSHRHAVDECTALGDTFKNDSTVDGQILTSEWYIPPSAVQLRSIASTLR